MKRLKRITAKHIRSWGPCIGWRKPGRVEEVFARHGVKSATPMDIARCKALSINDRLWILLRTEVIPLNELRLFCCWRAMRALKAEIKEGRYPDRRSMQAVIVARQYANGKATADELEAARGSAWSAAYAIRCDTRFSYVLAACHAAEATANDAVFVARCAAASISIEDYTERAAHMRKLRSLIAKLDKEN